jgi:hypothetical protein
LATFFSAIAADPPLDKVSLLQLLAQPEKYHEKEVLIIGYLHLEFEGHNLYLHKEDYDHGIIGNFIWVNSTEKMLTDIKRLNNKYVIIKGVFDAKAYGHMGLSAGTLKNITRCDVWSDPKTPRHKP